MPPRASTARQDGRVTTSAPRPTSWYLPVRIVLLLAAVLTLLLGSALDSTVVVFVAPLCLVAAAALDVAARRAGRQVPTPATIVALALIMGVAGFADWPPDATAWTFIGLSALAIVLALASSRPAHRRA